MPDIVAGGEGNLGLENDLVEGVAGGRIRAVARLISMVESESPLAIRCLKRLFPHTGRAFVVGVTGSPGAGKSTLVDHLAGAYRSGQEKVGIVAVDPTSPFTGGAILGDRIRMQSRSVDNGTFIRSMATRGHLGGLARATVDAISVLDAAGFGVVIVETVGVGQDEVEVIRAAHATVVVLVPGMGDDIQAMKAGIMEIGDVFVINKADHPGVERTEMELKSLLSMSRRDDGWEPPVIRTVATDGTGVGDCVTAVNAYRDFLHGSGGLRERTLQIEKYRLLEAIQSLLGRRLAEGNGGARLESLAGELAARSIDPYSAAEELLSSLVGQSGTGRSGSYASGT